MSGDRFNEYCEALLVRYNRRNTQTVTSRLEDLCRFLRQEGNHDSLAKSLCRSK